MAKKFEPVINVKTRPMKKGDWVGRRVRLLRPLENLASQRFEAGSVMLVTRNHGGLSLKSSESTPDKPMPCIRGVHEAYVALLHEWFNPLGLPGEACKHCGLVKHRDGGNDLDACHGRVRVGPR
jgi:hypothetical protein